MSTGVSSDRQVTRRFALVAGTSAKFWEVTVNRVTVHVHFGRIGSAGQRQTKEFADATAAAAHVQRLIAQKLAKGYLEEPVGE